MMMKTPTTVPTKAALVVLGVAFVVGFVFELTIWGEEYNHQYMLENNPKAANMTMEDLIQNGMPTRCEGPILLRQIFQPLQHADELEVCQSAVGENQDECFAIVSKRLEEVLGSNSTLLAYPMEHLATPKGHGVRHSNGETLTLHEYLTQPQYSNYVVHALHQVGNAQQYTELLQMMQATQTHHHKDDDNNDDATLLDVWGGLSQEMPNHHYQGSQIFLNRANHTGSHMHYEFGSNIFLLLAGRKRFIDVHPDFAYQANCSVGHNGFYGHCYPNDYTGENIAGTVSMDEYEAELIKAGVPPEGIVTFVMEAGDILLNCDLWVHAVENLAPSIGFSMRYRANIVTQMKWRLSTLQLLRDSFIMSFLELFRNPYGMTLFESAFNQQKGLMDQDERMKGLGVLNQKKTNSKD